MGALGLGFVTRPSSHKEVACRVSPSSLLRYAYWEYSGDAGLSAKVTLRKH